MVAQAQEWQRDLPCLVIAFAFHMAVLSGNPSLHWRSASRADAPIPVEFVTEVPKPPAATSQLAPSAPGAASAKEKGYGPGEARPEKIKAGLPDAAKAAPARKRRPMSAAQRAKVNQRIALAREEAARRAEMLRVERAEAARVAAESARARREEARRLAVELAARRAESARLKALHIAQAKAAKARKRAELEQQLASLPNPDVELSAARRGGPPAGGAEPRRAGARWGDEGRGPRRRLAGTNWRSGAFGAEAALESDLRDAVASAPGPSASLAGAFRASDSPAGNPGFARDGRGGEGDANQRPAGGGFEDGGGGPVSWLVEGPVGNRKVLKRILPRCPDWVSQRGLELTVQLRFQVLENGTVKTAVVLKRTSGFPDIDRLAIEALRRWKFQPIHSGVGLASPEAWGVISFKFLMG